MEDENSKGRAGNVYAPVEMLKSIKHVWSRWGPNNAERHAFSRAPISTDAPKSVGRAILVGKCPGEPTYKVGKGLVITICTSTVQVPGCLEKLSDRVLLQYNNARLRAARNLRQTIAASRAPTPAISIVIDAHLA